MGGVYTSMVYVLVYTSLIPRKRATFPYKATFGWWWFGPPASHPLFCDRKI